MLGWVFGMVRPHRAGCHPRAKRKQPPGASWLGNQEAFVFLGHHHITRSADTSAASGFTWSSSDLPPSPKKHPTLVFFPLHVYAKLW